MGNGGRLFYSLKIDLAIEVRREGGYDERRYGQQGQNHGSRHEATVAESTA
jgi:hypothetical protein